MFLIENMNLVKCLFILLAFSILLMSLFVNFFERFLPRTIIQTFRYGKFSYTGRKSFINYLEVPKSWFKHFYVIATLYSLFIFASIINVYIFGGSVPKVTMNMLNLIATKKRTVTVDATTAFFSVFLLCLQIWRRLYETCVVSVFSNCRINVVHYFIGIVHYLGAITAIVVESPAFATPSFRHKTNLSLWNLNFRCILGTIIFFWAWYHQFQTAVILANLRKDKKGNVITYEHRIPVGGLFDKLSSPHMFCEMMIYLSLNIILWGHTIWPYVFFWVLCNQCETALLNHWWYKSNFQVYPKQRKAFLPFIL